MTIRVSIDGNDELRAALDRLGDAVSAEVAKEVYRTALELRTDIIQRIQGGPATGRVYTRRGVVHQASAPGEAPASDTGRLANSVYIADGQEGGKARSVTVGSALAYAAYLEYGTRNMSARPVWTPAAHEAERKFKGRLEKVVMGATR